MIPCFICRSKKNKEALETYKNLVDTERDTIGKIEEQLKKLLLKAHIPSPGS